MWHSARDVLYLWTAHCQAVVHIFIPLGSSPSLLSGLKHTNSVFMMCFYLPEPGSILITASSEAIENPRWALISPTHQRKRWVFSFCVPQTCVHTLPRMHMHCERQTWRDTCIRTHTHSFSVFPCGRSVSADAVECIYIYTFWEELWLLAVAALTACAETVSNSSCWQIKTRCHQS